MKTKNRKPLELIMVMLIFILIAVFISSCSGMNQKNAYHAVNKKEQIEESIAQNLQRLTYEEVYIRAIEPMNDVIVFNGNYDQTVVNGHFYDFNKAISEQERNEFILSEEKILNLLNESGWNTEEIHFCIQKDYPGRVDSENLTVYCGMDHINDWELVVFTLQVLNGDYTNYGYLYGTANNIARELEYVCDDTYLDTVSAIGTEIPTIENIKTYTEESGTLQILKEEPDKATLVYPLFQEKFSDIDTIKSVKQLSALCSLLVQNIPGGEEKFLAVLLEYQRTSEIGIPENTYEYTYGGSECPLKIRTKYYECFISKDYEEDIYVQLGYMETEWSKDIEIMTETLEKIDNETERIAKLFSYEPSGYFPVYILSNLSLGGTVNSNYIGEVNYNDLNPYGEVTTIWYLPLGYCKNIVFHTIDQQEYQYAVDYNMQWLLRGMMDYETFEIFSLPEMKYYWSEDVIASYEEILGKKVETAQDYLDVLKADYACSHVQEYENGNFDAEAAISTWTDNYIFTDSYMLTDYLVRTYGEEQMIEASMNPSKVVSILGKNWNEILDDWEIDLFEIIG
jgi:hypothetical protein